MPIPFQETRHDRADLRLACNALRLFHFCPRTACRKARSCCGDPQDCIDTRTVGVPAQVMIWITLRYLPNPEWPAASRRELEKQWPREYAAYEHWIAGLEAGRRVRRAV